ncbi:protein of unknown function [Methylocaldum szegediense]|uniref:Uncharacterized protein n=1 Tax=Methylocaldum szegediense TaxID=73780 RepID=A0ABM9HVY1_9GAMM|nr:protein of unknown function [Methylocaldum szegediense]
MARHLHPCHLDPGNPGLGDALEPMEVWHDWCGINSRFPDTRNAGWVLRAGSLDSVVYHRRRADQTL